MKKAVVVCPGRGTYNKPELGYLARYHGGNEQIAQFDSQRSSQGQPTLLALDGAAAYSIEQHGRGDNASALIFACSALDFLSIDRRQIDIVAVTGNSMGWYTALACAGALTLERGFGLANTMGRLMQQHSIGSQLVYPFVDDEWRPDPARRRALLSLVEDIASRPGHALWLSIDLGGMVVLAGDRAGLDAFVDAVPPVGGRYPMRLSNHAGFHCPLQAPVAAEARQRMGVELLAQPSLPLVDGRGAIWWPHASSRDELWAYTLAEQVTVTYDFTRAIAVCAREFAPDLFIVTGPGNTLGGAVAQAMIQAGWRGMRSKADFSMQQERAAVLASMGLPEQRALVLG